MKIYAVGNFKGGTGKTTTALNLAYALAMNEEPTLLVDMDPQGNLSQSFTYAPPAHLTLAPVLMGKLPLASIVTEVSENLYLAPGSDELLQAEKHLQQEPGGELVLREILAAVRGGLANIVIDTPPSPGLLTRLALTAADVVVIPVQPEYYGLEGLAKFVGTVQQIQRRLNPGLRIGGILFTRYNRNDKRLVLKDMVALLEGHPELGPHVLDYTIPENVTVKQAQARKENLLATYPESAAAVAYQVLASHLRIQS